MTTGGNGKQIIRVIRGHLDEIRGGGRAVLLRKVQSALGIVPRLMLRLILLPLWPILLIQMALRPLVFLRFGPLISAHIGHFAGNTELYFCRRDAGMDRQGTCDVFFHRGTPCNQQLKRMWERLLHVSPIARPMYFLNRNLPGGGSHVARWIPFGERDVHGLMMRTPAHLSFTPEEEHLGREGLQMLGVPEGAPFICFHARDSAYYEAAAPKENMSFHDFRDNDIQDCVSAAEEMTRRGCFAVRMGAVVRKALKTDNPMVIDYAVKHRSDFMDIFLCAKCRYFIGDLSGLGVLPMIFRKPVAFANVIPIQNVPLWGPDNLFIPKKLRLRAENRLLTFAEIFDSQADCIRWSEEYQRMGIEPVENTAEEITALAVEMDERLKGTWRTTEEDEELQRRFRLRFKPDARRQGVIVSRIGADFLRRNRELLD